MPKRTFACLLAAVLVAAAPPRPFDPEAVPPAPDYAQPGAWLAFPGRNGPELSVPPGTPPPDEARAAADVFFIHPTTYTANDVWNAAYDAPAPLNLPVLLGQVSVFNGCCRLYAPQYRQTSLAGLSDPQAKALAYADVARAFRYFIAHESHGRPFILASHSQGTVHAVQLLQREIIGTPLQGRMIAAYLIGSYVPDRGLPICDAPRQTGCVLSYNSAKPGAKLARVIIEPKTYWWQGSDVPREHGQPPAVCVDPLSWRAGGASPATANQGSLPFPKAPFPAHAAALPALIPALTETRCNTGMLEVGLSPNAPAGFHDKLSAFFGSYHLNDYGLFYASLRQNAADRTAAWLAGHHD
jgi:hypothetical protein